MASRLAAQGVPLVVHNRTRAKAEALAQEGVRVAATPREVGRAASGSILFTCLSDGHALRTALFGRSGVANGAGRGTLVVDLSTIDPEESRECAGRLAAGGIRFLDAPMGGSVDAASTGELLLYVGGAAEDLARAEPLLARFSRRRIVAGSTGSGSSLKLVNNLITLSTVALDAEALAFGERLGLDPTAMLDALLDGGARSQMLENKRSFFAQRSYPPRFKLTLARKDLELVRRSARAHGTVAPIAREAERLIEAAIRQGHGELDVAAAFEAARTRDAPKRADAPSTTDPTE
ncbi:MAG: NAD(P)-dependent oxidoreductase [Thermoplasmata archaeon]